MLAGRDFADSDTATSPHVGIINQQFAQRFFPNQNPLGRSIGTEDGRYQMTVVGVVKDHKYRSIDEEPIPMAWYMYAQIPMTGAMHVEMRVHGEPLAILPSARKALQQINPNLPLIRPMTQRAQYDLTISGQVLFARLAGFFGLLAVVLVATGLYGTLAYRVSMRTAEIGVRMAVGARRGQVVWMILKGSLLLTMAGVVMGVPPAMLVGRALTSSLYGVKPLDAMSYLFALGGSGFGCVRGKRGACQARSKRRPDESTTHRIETQTLGSSAILYLCNGCFSTDSRRGWQVTRSLAKDILPSGGGLHVRITKPQLHVEGLFTVCSFRP